MKADTFPSPENDRLLDRRELRNKWGVTFCRQHLIRLEERGQFPRRVRLGSRSVGWWESEVRAWWRERDAERTTRNERPVAAAGGAR